MAISSYDELLNAIDDYTDRSYSTARKALWVGNAEAKFNRKLTSSFRRSMDTTLTTDSTGLAPLPSGFVGLQSVVRDVTGSAPLKQVSWDALVSLNPYALDGEPTHYAIQGTSFKVAPIAEDDYTAVFDSLLTPLSSTVATNWLLALAPDCYLTMCLAEEALFTREFAAAAGLEGSASGMLADIVNMDQVAELGNTEMVLEGVAP